MPTQHLLTDQQMQRFIADGYLLVQADYPATFHQNLYKQIETVFEKERNPGNNILPRIPQIQQVFDHPAVAGALTSLLGSNYLMHAHRHCHLNPPGSPGQRWHKDNYVFDQNIRHSRFRWVLAFYYPQDVSEAMGPTGLIAGQQYYHHISDDNAAKTTEPELPLCGPAGTVAIVHYDSWHRATANVSDKKRYMLKFLFERMAEPQAPTWQATNPAWVSPENDRHHTVNEGVWHWLSGNSAKVSANGSGVASDSLTHLIDNLDAPTEAHRAEAAQALTKYGAAALDAAPKLIAALSDQSEAVRINAAHALGAMGAAVLPLLQVAFRNEAKSATDQFLAKMPGNPRGDNPAAFYTAEALAAIGEPAVPSLIQALDDEHWCVRATAADTLGNIGLLAQTAIPALTMRLKDKHHRVRRHAAEALGRMGAVASSAVPALIDTLTDEATPVRYNAALTLARIGPAAAEATLALATTLLDEDRYVRYFAAVALRRIGTAQANQILLDAMFTGRWCPITTPETMY